MIQLPVLRWFDKDTIRHMRFRFSFFLLPVFLFALSQTLLVNWKNAVLSFIILHFLVFPSSNGYNSYEDRDEGSIGGLKHPPRVNRNLYRVTLLFDLIALLLALFISAFFSFLVLVFIIMSRMYSYRGIRLKKYPVTGFLVVFIFQGAFVYFMTMVAASTQYLPALFTYGNVVCMIVASLFIGSMYPLTQIYQHEADHKDGVISLSYLLGYKGTFMFSAVMFGVATALLLYYFGSRDQFIAMFMFVISLLPVILFLGKWFFRVRQNHIYADYEHTMKANTLSSICMNLFFLILLINEWIIIF